VASAAAVGALRARVPRTADERTAVQWATLAAGIAIFAIGLAFRSPVVVGLGAALIAGVAAFLAPQLLLMSYLVAAGLKGAPWLAGVPIDLTILTALGVMAAMLVRATKPDGIHPFPPAVALAVGVVAITMLSVLWSPAPDIGLTRALRFASFTMVAFFAPLILIRTRRDLTRLMMFLVAATLVIVFTSVPGESPNLPRVVPGGSEIELALYASTGLVAVVYLLLVLRSQWRILWLAAAVPMADALLQAGSRGVLVASIVAMGVVGVMAIARSRTKVVPIAVFTAGVIAAVFAASQLTGAAAVKYAGTFGGGDSAQVLGKRNFLLQDGIALALDYPLGRGVGGYEFEVGFGWPHNIFVEAAAEEGIIGLTLLLALVIAAGRSVRRAREGPLSPEAILGAGMLIVVVGDCMVSQTFTTFRLLWFGLGLALAVPWIAATAERRDAA
jgi:O-antigen ligase